MAVPEHEDNSPKTGAATRDPLRNAPPGFPSTHSRFSRPSPALQKALDAARGDNDFDPDALADDEQTLAIVAALDPYPNK